MVKVSPEPESEKQSQKSTKSCNKEIENSDISSVITGKIIGPNYSPQDSKRVRFSNTPRRLARSASEVVEEKEEQEKNFITRFSLRGELDIFQCRCKSCFKAIVRYVTCTAEQIIEEE